MVKFYNRLNGKKDATEIPEGSVILYGEHREQIEVSGDTRVIQIRSPEGRPLKIITTGPNSVSIECEN